MPFNWRTKCNLFFLKTCLLPGELSSIYFSQDMPFNWRTKFNLFFLKTCPLTGELSSIHFSQDMPFNWRTKFRFFFFFSFQECGKLNHLDPFHMSPNCTSNWPLYFFLLLLLPTTVF